MEPSPRLFETATRPETEAGNRIPDAHPWRLHEIEGEGTPLPEAGETEPGLVRLPLCGSWLHAYSPSPHTYPCEDDESCDCAHCAGEPCNCEDC